MKERSIVSTVTLLASLAAYYYAKHNSKDPAPLVMIGGFFGAMLGEVVAQVVLKDDDDAKSQNNQNQLNEKNT